ncbi:MAG: inositol monophosphatase [Balneola sp.]|nr:inositol monophosphatase [Balneola sp.]|tara:strand:+ start:189 stop:1013 length:825 start_codon:yes stop_codon:yes gene_type:complete
MKSTTKKNYKKELNAVKALLPELEEIINKLRADSEFRVEEKAKNDLVTTADLASEAYLVDQIKELFPNDVIWAEENYSKLEELNQRIWIIDPIDGTTNFSHGFAPYCISIALWDRIELVVGLVYELAHKQCFYATKGEGAYLNGSPLQVSSRSKPDESLIATGFPYTEFSQVDPFLALLKLLFRETNGVRRAGSASYDLCAVAAGWVEGFFEQGLNAWDVAAGGLIVKEAGGELCDWDGGDKWLMGNQIIAGNNPIKKYLLKRIQGIYPGLASA